MENKITQEQVMALLARSEKMVLHRVHGKCTIVSVKLPNGFVITQDSCCVDPANYSESMGEQLCMEKIEGKVWELEGYVLQNRLASIDPAHEAKLAARRAKRRARRDADLPGRMKMDFGDAVPSFTNPPGRPANAGEAKSE